MRQRWLTYPDTHSSALDSDEILEVVKRYASFQDSDNTLNLLKDILRGSAKLR
jgi:hypothetical protein